MSQGIVEIRDYTFEAEWLEAYRQWATELAAPWLKANMDLVDFWMDCDIPAEVEGSNPKVSEHGQANVCWIIRWPSKADRDAGFAALMRNREWLAIWAKHPNEHGYLQINSRFMKAVI